MCVFRSKLERGRKCNSYMAYFHCVLCIGYVVSPLRYCVYSLLCLRAIWIICPFLALLPIHLCLSLECNHTTVVTVGQCEPITQILCDLVCCGCRVVCVEEHSTSIVEYDLVLCITTLVAPCLNMCVRMCIIAWSPSTYTVYIYSTVCILRMMNRKRELILAVCATVLFSL